MLKFINLKKLTAKTLIGILMIGSLVTQSNKKAVAANGVQGIEVEYHHSDFKCSAGGNQADIKVYVYDKDNTLLKKMSRGENFIFRTVNSVNDLKFRYQFNQKC